MSPPSLVLVHGAGSGPWVYHDWRSSFLGLKTVAVDLQEGLDIACARHDEYASNVIRIATQLSPPVALCGWSMGGLVVLQAAQWVLPRAVILIESSPPSQVQGFHADVELREGTFDPEDAYGLFPKDMPARAESLLARCERKRGISIPALACPSLVVYGDDFADNRGRAIAELYGSEERAFPGLNHWDLVRSAAVRTAIADYLGRLLDSRPHIAASAVERRCCLAVKAPCENVRFP